MFLVVKEIRGNGKREGIGKVNKWRKKESKPLGWLDLLEAMHANH
jgi:hypothetical protein